MSEAQNRGNTFLYGAHVRANGIRQHYLRYGGHGPRLILIPGITSPAVTWGFVGERLGERFDTYVLDVRGRGLSEAGPHLKYTLDAYAADVAELARALAFDEYLVLGHSMGARIAVRLGHRFPQGISRLVAADPPLSGPGRRPYVRDIDFYLKPIHEARAGRLDIDSVRATYPKWTEANLRLRAEWLHTCDDTAIVESVRGFQNEDVYGDFAALRMPTLLLVAGHGGVINQEELAEVRARLPGIAVEHIRHTGHMMPFEDLEAFLAAVTQFLLAGS